MSRVADCRREVGGLVPLECPRTASGPPIPCRNKHHYVAILGVRLEVRGLASEVLPAGGSLGGAGKTRARRPCVDLPLPGRKVEIRGLAPG